MISPDFLTLLHVTQPDDHILIKGVGLIPSNHLLSFSSPPMQEREYQYQSERKNTWLRYRS